MNWNLKTLSKISLIVFTLLIMALVAFKILAPWQLNKHEQVIKSNEKIQNGIDSEPIPINKINNSNLNNLEWQKVTLVGKYIDSQSVLIRLRQYYKTPAFEVISMFQTLDNKKFFINRGYISNKEQKISIEIPRISNKDEIITIIGYIRKSETADNYKLQNIENTPQIQKINIKNLRSNYTFNELDGYIQLATNQIGVLTAIPIEKYSLGPYLSYGIQWIILGIFSPFLAFYFIRLQIKNKKTTTKVDSNMEKYLVERYR